MRSLLGGVRTGAIRAFRRAATERRLQGEIGWVLASRTVEFGLTFALLKLLTNVLGKDGFGEFNLSETAITLLACVLLIPVHEPFFRDYHGARQRSELRASGLLLLRWYLGSTLGAVAIAGVWSRELGERLGVGPWTVLACGLLFCFDRWRFLGQEMLNIERRRRTWALQNIGYWVTKLALASFALGVFGASPSVALFAVAGAAGVFAIVSARPLLAEIRSAPPGPSSRLPRLVVSFGIPAAILLIFQWIQGFGDRYLLNSLVDTATAGLYVACYQVCGIPYQFTLRMTHSLLTPIAYQRGRDITDPAQLWSADRVLIAGIGAQAVLGAAMLGVYAALGTELLILLTSPEFVLSSTTIILLAAGRYVQALAQALQPIFAVHHRMGSMLSFRLVGAVLTLGICGVSIYHYGVVGAAAGSLVSTLLYALGLLFAPNGCWWMVARVRALSNAARNRPV